MEGVGNEGPPSVGEVLEERGKVWGGVTLRRRSMVPIEWECPSSRSARFFLERIPRVGVADKLRTYAAGSNSGRRRVSDGEVESEGEDEEGEEEEGGRRGLGGHDCGSSAFPAFSSCHGGTAVA